MSIVSIVLSVLFGAVSGIVGGLGMGGGTLLIPLLTIFLSYQQKLAQGINLIAFLAMAIFSLIIHVKNGYVKVKGVLPLMVFGVLFAVVGSLVAGIVPTQLLRRFFGAFLCVLSIWQIIKMLKK